MARAVIGYLTDGNVRNEFFTSVYRATRKGTTEIADVLSVVSGPNLSKCRNKLVEGFLGSFDVPWLLMVDADMVFAADTLDRLIAAADSAVRPIVGALCFQELEGQSDPVPTLFELVKNKRDEVGLVRYSEWPDSDLMKVAATGTGCLLMHRTALENMAIRLRTKGTAWPWFKESNLGSVPIGEDLTFCLRAGMARIPVYVHTGIQVGHVKTTMLGKVT